MRTKVGRWVSEMEEIAKAFGDLALTLKIRQGVQGVAEISRFVGSSSMVDTDGEVRFVGDSGLANSLHHPRAEREEACGSDFGISIKYGQEPHGMK
jgi:hypothetical protein